MKRSFSDMEHDIKQPIILIDTNKLELPKSKKQYSPTIGDSEQPDFSFIFRMT